MIEEFERHLRGTKSLRKHDILVPFCPAAIQLAVRWYHEKEPASV